MSETVIKLDNIDVFFDKGKEADQIKAVQNVSLEVEKGDIYGVVGYSGAGKSTLVRVINLLQIPTNGTITINGKVIFSNQAGKQTMLSAKELREERRGIGMIFQHFNLLEERTVIENVKFALRHSHLKEKEIDERAQELLDLVDLGDRGDAYPAQLSGGQQQRVAIARALANKPDILISDEATSALDPKNTTQILELLARLNKELGLTIVLITHEMDAVKKVANKVAVMSAGQIIERGSLLDIFTNSQSELTKELVGTEQNSQDALSILRKSQNTDAKNTTILKLTYEGNSTSDPIVTKLYSEFGVQASIIYGNVELLRDTPVGTLYVVVSGDDDSRRKAIDYLHTAGVQATEISLSEGSDK
ncbi:methionine ABC transporter ATP-binding protein [Lentilactobacillus sp. SPB1-3]|uniref:Methionine ABC transporter ATP-binding protein n=1 Tax=Lentilactobacillus terminaliae TaxID=3003483 RepID=A0ACD5DCS9_9LACO|nr:methionine ABC transporter ATP-binding protein [Lentilactobacillus sp. SPB1-3]MCZ0977964.1 methionine ABC transporter ATP-binding protein [Lentilactobacillus sp. SPB1-3]